MRSMYTIFLLTFLLAGLSATGQGSRHLTMDEAIASALANNHAVKMSGLDEQIAKARYQQTNAIFLPQLGLSYTAFNTNNPLNAFGFKLQQKLITAADFNPDLLNHPSSTSDFTTKFELQQPLLNMDMLYQRKAANKQIELYKLSTQRTKEYLSFETQKAYLQLQLAYNGESVLKEALATAKAFQKTAHDYFDQGMIQKSDLLNADVHVSSIETQLSAASSAIKDASDMLSLLMGQPTGTVYTIDSASYNNKLSADTLLFTTERADFKAMQKAMDAYALMIKASKMSYLPRLNAFGSYQLNDNRMLGFGANAYMAGVQLSWTLFNGTRTKHTITQQSLEKDKLAQQLDQQKSEAQLQIAHAKRQIEEAAFAIKQQKLSVEQSAEALRVTQNRYAQGLVKTADVLMAQTQLSQQQLGYAQAVFNHNLAMAYLQFLTSK